MKIIIALCLFGVLCVHVVHARVPGTNALKDVICKLGSRVGISCNSVAIVPSATGDAIEVKFKISNADGSVLLMKGCQQSAPALYSLIDTLTRKDHVKENLVKLFTNRELLKEIDSDRCTLIQANLPRMGSSQSIKIDCANTKCLTFKATPEGTSWIKIRSQTITSMMNGIPIGFTIDNAVIAFDFRTATVPRGLSPSFHAIPLKNQPNSASIDMINLMATETIDASLQSVRDELIRGEQNPNDVSLWNAPPSKELFKNYFIRDTKSLSFKEMICDMLQHHDLSCESLKIVANDQTVEVRFEKEKREVMVLFKAGCQTSAPRIYEVIRSIGVDHMKDIIIKVFTTPELLAQIDSAKCTLIAAKIPIGGSTSGEFHEYHCDGTECLTFKATAEGTTYVHAENMVHHLLMDSKMEEFSVHAKVKFDFRTAKVPEGFKHSFVASPLPNHPNSHFIDSLNDAVPQLIAYGLDKMHNILVQGEPNPNDVSLWPYNAFFHMLKSNVIAPKKTLKDVLCSVVQCETVKILKEANDKLTIEFGEKNKKSSFTIKTGCEKTIIDLYNLFEKHQNGGLKEFLVALYTRTELLNEVSNEQCSLYRAEYHTSDGLVTIDCGTTPTATKSCISLQTSQEGTTVLTAKNLYAAITSLDSSVHQVEYVIPIMKLVFDVRTATIPNNQLPVFHAEPIEADISADDLVIIQILNMTGKYLLENQLNDLASLLRRGEKDPNNVSLWPHQSNRENFDHQMYHIVRFVSTIFSKTEKVDSAQIAEDLLKAVALIPKCVEQTMSSSNECPSKCYEGLETLRNNLEIDSKNNVALLDTARFIGYLTEEAKRICNEMIGSPFEGTPNPRPQFSVMDLVPVGTAATECVNEMQNDALQCMKGCNTVMTEMGRLISKYLHVTLGKIVEEVSMSAMNMCEETEGICFSVPEGTEQSCTLVLGTGTNKKENGRCEHGRCVASVHIWA